VRAALVVAIAILALAGCGGTTIDGGDLEDEIIEDAAGAGLVIDAADCPSPDAEEGATFECTVTVKGQDTQLEIEQRNDDGDVEYDFEAVVEGPAVNDTAADETSIRSVIDAVNKDVTALCDYATPEFRREIASKENCAKAVLAEYDELLGDYEVSIDEDKAAAADGKRTVALARQKNGSWLITDIR
jgi:hypothetical protein